MTSEALMKCQTPLSNRLRDSLFGSNTCILITNTLG